MEADVITSQCHIAGDFMPSGRQNSIMKAKGNQSKANGVSIASALNCAINIYFRMKN